MTSFTPNDRRASLLNTIKKQPLKIAHSLGFTLLNEMHNEWMCDMFNNAGEDTTLQAHRGSYKTTCVAVVLFLFIICKPNLKIVFFRKTDTDVKEIIRQIQMMLKTDVAQYIVHTLWGVDLKITIENATEISTNLCNDPRGGSQLIGRGIGGSITGKHYDIIFTDDIVNVEDRTSKAERDKTRLFYQELQNIVNRGWKCRIYNTGTPWHKEDAFELMPPAKKYDVYQTGLISEAEQAEIKSKMLPSLYAANYELKHIASEDVIFTDPQVGYDPKVMYDCNYCHIDAAYEGQDYTAFTICQKKDGKYYVFGKVWRKHVDDVKSEIIRYRKAFRAGRIYCEDNGDKGYLAKDLRRLGEAVTTYHENMNKMLKITTYLKFNWKDIIFVQGTDSEYIQQICDYTEEAPHDDAPDSLACMVRQLYNKKDEAYRSIFG